MTNLIYFDPSSRIFHLCNKSISYIFSITGFNTLSHIYFGKYLKTYHGQLEYPLIDRGFSGNPFSVIDRGYSLDTIPQEVSGNDSGDYRVPSIEIKFINGNSTNKLSYKKHDIQWGKPKLEGLPSSFVDNSDEAQTLIVTLEDETKNYEIDLIYTIFRNIDIICRSTKIRNTGQELIEIKKVSSLQMDFTGKYFDSITLPGSYANERMVEREDITYGIKKFSSSRGASSHHMNPFIALVGKNTDEFQGEVYGYSLVYSGNHSIEVEKDHIDQLRLIIGINNQNFSWILDKEKSFQTPEVIMTYTDGGINSMSNNFHNFVNKSIIRKSFQGTKRPILINNWEATYFDFNMEKLKLIVDDAFELGIEMFVLDDGWFGKRNSDKSSLGDWFVNKEKFPKGIDVFAEYVHLKGMKFGIWLEPEMISLDSDLYRKHPEYMIKVPNISPTASRSQFVLDMGRKEVRENIFNQIDNILGKGNIDYVKWDMNRHLADLHSIELSPEKQGEVSHRYILGVYELLDKIISKYPNILFEGCSGGGGRFDLGWSYYMPQSWASDNTDPFARLLIQYGTSLLYPFSTITSHVSASPNHQTGRDTSLETRAHVAMSGVLGYELDLNSLSQTEKNKIRDQILAYKKIRNLVQFGDFYRLQGPIQSSNNISWQFVSKDKKETVVLISQKLSSARPVLTKTKLLGLNINEKYKNTELLKVDVEENKIGYFESDDIYSSIKLGEEFYGDELMNMGIYNPIKRTDFITFLYYFKAE